jgi:hypothetical protein
MLAGDERLDDFEADGTLSAARRSRPSRSAFIAIKAAYAFKDKTPTSCGGVVPVRPGREPVAEVGRSGTGSSKQGGRRWGRSFPATGITAYPKNGGMLEKAGAMANFHNAENISGTRRTRMGLQRPT